MGKSKRQSDANGYASPSLDAGSQVRRFVVDTGGLTADSLYLVLGGSKTVHDLRGRMQHMTSYPLQQREQQNGDPGSGGVCVFVHRRRRRCRAPRAAALLRCCAAALLRCCAAAALLAALAALLLRCWLHLLPLCPEGPARNQSPHLIAIAAQPRAHRRHQRCARRGARPPQAARAHHRAAPRRRRPSVVPAARPRRRRRRGCGPGGGGRMAGP